MLFLTLLLEPPEVVGLQGKYITFSTTKHLDSFTKSYDVTTLWLMINGHCYPLHVEKAEMFLELYGNSMLRAHTSDYMRMKATELIK